MNAAEGVFHFSCCNNVVGYGLCKLRHLSFSLLRLSSLNQSSFSDITGFLLRLPTLLVSSPTFIACEFAGCKVFVEFTALRSREGWRPRSWVGRKEKSLLCTRTHMKVDTITSEIELELMLKHKLILVKL